MFVRAGRSHGAQAPVTGGRFNAGEPRRSLLRSGAVRIFGAEARHGCGVMLVVLMLASFLRRAQPPRGAG